MGNEISGEGQENYYNDEDDYAKQFDGIETLGYRVLGVQPDSPASKAGLVSFFDFIVGANHQMLLGSGVGLEEGEEYDDVDFPNLLRENIHQPVLLLVYNIKSREQREVQLIPSDNWGGAGLLGVTIKLDDYGGADEKLVRVLEVDSDHNGPAKLAGLIEKEDFLLGTTATTLTNTDVLASLLTMHLEQVVELYVYNFKTDLVRIVGLHPTYQWGYGESMLGAAVGTGYLHRLPESCRGTNGKSVERTVSILGEPPSPTSGEINLDAGNVRMEGTLEMEVEEEGDAVDGDVGLAARGMQVQPHRLGQPQTTTTQQLDPPSSTEEAGLPAEPPAAEQAPDNNSHDAEPAPTIQEPPATPVANPPPPPPENEAAVFPEEASLPMPSFSTPQPHPPPPPPPAAQFVPPPPPPAEPAQTQFVPPPPPPPPEVTSPDPPTGNENDDEYTDDEEGSEYTDGSECTDDEESETPEAPRSGGLFGFMAPPPKMNY